MADQTIELQNLFLKLETWKAYFIEDSDGNDAWLPKSLITRIEFGEVTKELNGKSTAEITILEIPEWLAQEKNL